MGKRPAACALAAIFKKIHNAETSFWHEQHVGTTRPGGRCVDMRPYGTVTKTTKKEAFSLVID